MNGSTWVDLIKRIPEARQDNLVAVTGTGAEIMVQKILVVEEGYMIFRGRPAGSTDAPRILLMPFDQLNHLAFNSPLPEPEILAMFGPGMVAVGDVPVKAEAAPPIPAPPIAAVEQTNNVEEPPPAKEPPPPQNPAPAPTSSAKHPPSKSVLLARLRARLAKN
jgi:hypothetical protein